MMHQDDPRFLELAAFVLDVEGDYVNDPKDTGGPTMRGIAWNFNQQILKEMGLARNTMRKLTKEQALEVYYQKYYLASYAEQIRDKRLALIQFDTAVNCGVGKAVEMRAKLSTPPQHLAAGLGANEIVWQRLFLEYFLMRLEWYEKCLSRKEHLEGWVNRMIALGHKALNFK